MALKSTVIAHGKVIRTKSREVKAKDGREFIFTNAVIVGDNTMVDVRVPDDLVLQFRDYVGEDITAVIELSTYRDDVEASIVEVLTVGIPLDFEALVS